MVNFLPQSILVTAEIGQIMRFKFNSSDLLWEGRCNALFWWATLGSEWADTTQSSCTSGTNESTQCEGTWRSSRRASSSSREFGPVEVVQAGGSIHPTSKISSTGSIGLSETLTVSSPVYCVDSIFLAYNPSPVVKRTKRLQILHIMSSNSERDSRYGHRGLLNDSTSPGQRQVPDSVTASHAARNEASDNSMQFNADVGRHTIATFSRDTVQIEDNRVGDGHVRAEQGHVNVHVGHDPLTKIFH